MKKFYEGPPWAGTALFLVIAGACSPESSGDERATQGSGSAQPNLVLLLIDTLRPDHLSTYGYKKQTAPFLARLAEDSWVWTRAFSTSSWTPPSTASVFTGLYPTEHGVTSGFDAKNRPKMIEVPVLPSVVGTLPERLGHAGYRNFGVAANINIGSQLGFDRGFDRFELMHKSDGHELVDKLLTWRTEIQGETPYFLYAHFNDVHRPYNAREPWYEEKKKERRDTIAKYDSEITYLDSALERFFAEMAFDDQTVVILISDHGEGFGNHETKGHGYNLNLELNRVLMMMHAPALTSDAQHCDVNVSLIDVFATLLDLGGDRADAGHGVSLVPLVRGEVGPAELDRLNNRALFAHRTFTGRRKDNPNAGALWAAIQGPWKLIHDEVAGTAQLFDLDADPDEVHDQRTARPDVFSQLTGALESFRASTKALDSTTVEIPMDDELLDHLEALGYAGEDD